MNQRPDMRQFEESFANSGGFTDAESLLEIDYSQRCDALRMAILDSMTEVVRIDVNEPTWAHYELAPKFADSDDHDNVTRRMTVIIYKSPATNDTIHNMRIISNEIVQSNGASWFIGEDFVIDNKGNTQYTPKTAALTKQSMEENQVTLAVVNREGKLLVGGFSKLPTPAAVGDEASNLPFVFPFGDFTCIESSIDSLDHGRALLNELANATAHLIKTSNGLW